MIADIHCAGQSTSQPTRVPGLNTWRAGGRPHSPCHTPGPAAPAPALASGAPETRWPLSSSSRFQLGAAQSLSSNCAWPRWLRAISPSWPHARILAPGKTRSRQVQSTASPAPLCPPCTQQSTDLTVSFPPGPSREPITSCRLFLSRLHQNLLTPPPPPPKCTCTWVGEGNSKQAVSGTAPEAWRCRGSHLLLVLPVPFPHLLECSMTPVPHE